MSVAAEHSAIMPSAAKADPPSLSKLNLLLITLAQPRRETLSIRLEMDSSLPNLERGSHRPIVTIS